MIVQFLPRNHRRVASPPADLGAPTRSLRRSQMKSRFPDKLAQPEQRAEEILDRLNNGFQVQTIPGIEFIVSLEDAVL